MEPRYLKLAGGTCTRYGLALDLARLAVALEHSARE
jgi:hypothetical protein